MLAPSTRLPLPLQALLAAAALAACSSNSATVTVAIAPQTATVAAGGEAQFSASVAGSSDTAVTWSVQEGPSGGTITQGGAYTAPSSPGTYHVLASSHADPSRGGIATVVVSAGLSLTITLNESSATLLEGGTQQFTAIVTGASDTTVSWTVLEGAAGGSVSSSGLYTAPEADGLFHVVATSNADSTKTATAAVTVEAPPTVVAVALSPTQVSVPALGTQLFNATVTGTSNTAVTWSVEESAGGAIDQSGNYTAPDLGGTFHVLATSVADSSKSAVAEVEVGTPPVITLSVTPTTASIASGATQQLIASVSNTPDIGVAWTVDESGAGRVDANGLYTAPIISTTQTFHVRATSTANPSASAASAVTVSAALAVTVAVTPSSASLPANAQLQLSATVANAASGAVTWSVDESLGGSITTGGLYTAPDNASSTPFHVRATSVSDTSVSGAALITVSAPSAVAVTVLPSSATLASQAQQQFSASVANATTDVVTWDIVEGASGGSITLGGLYTAPIVQSSTTFHVRATSVADNSKVGLAPVTITPPPAIAIAIAPLAPTIAADGQQQFSATVSNSTVTSVTWSVAEVGTGGSINTNGLYTAPNSAGTFHVVATSAANPSVTATAAVTVLAPPPISVSLTPTSVSLAAGAQQQFTATVSNAVPDDGVTWSIDESNAGTISSSGLYTAPYNAGNPFHVRATSVDDPSKYTEALVTVAAPLPISVTVSPSAAYVQTGTGWQFTASVANSTNTAVAWSVVGTNSGTITSGGYYTAPTTAGAYTVKATAAADGTTFGTATVYASVQPPNVVVTVAPTTTQIPTNGSATFTATVTGTSNNAVTWSVPGGSTQGTMTSGGVYTAPATAGSYTVRATSAANGTSYGQVTVQVDSVAVAISPTTKTLPQGATQQFTAQVTIGGSSSTIPTTVTWSVKEGANGGTVNSTGLYTTPTDAPYTAHVIATAVADPTQSATAVVTVNAPIAPAPANLVATPGNGSVTLTWSSATGAVTYNVYFAQHNDLVTSGPPVGEGVLPGATSGVVVEGLNNGTEYDFVVTSVNTGGESGDSSVASATPFDGSLPQEYAVFPLPGAIGVPLAVAPWIEFTKPMNTSTLAASFKLENGTTALQGSVAFDGERAVFTAAALLAPNTTYTAVVSGARDTAGNTFAPFQWTFTTQAPPTDTVRVLLGDSALTLSWDAVAGAEYYTIYRSTVTGGPYTAIYGTTGLSFTDLAVSNATNYFYVITATTSTGEGAQSEEAQGSPSSALPSAPAGLAATPGNQQVQLTWNSAGANLTYNIYRGTASGGPYTYITTAGTDQFYVDTAVTQGNGQPSLANGTAYYYVLTSIDTHQNSSAYSSEVTATPAASVIAAPTGLTATKGNGFVQLNWQPVAGAIGYEILRTSFLSGNPYSPLFATTGNGATSYVDTTATNNTTYFYVVAAVDSNSNIGTYSQAVEGDPAQYQATLAASNLTVVYAYNGRVSLSWTAAPGATGYQLNRAIGSGTPTPISTGGATSYVDHNLTNGTTYTYTVTAMNSYGSPPTNTATSTAVQATPVNYSPLGAITNVVANAGVNTVTITWTPVPGVDSYTVNYGTQPGVYNNPNGAGSASTYPLVIFTNLANGSPFYFQVVGTSTDASGNTITTSTGATPAATATPVALNQPGQPVFTASFAGEQLSAPGSTTTIGAVDLFWNPVVVPGNSNPVSFNLYRTSGLPAGWTRLNGSTPLTETGYVDSSAQNGVSYWYAVAPVLNGVEGPWSNPYSALTPSATDPLPPSNFTVYPGNNYATITWPNQAGASYYSFYSSPVPGGPFTLINYAETYPSITLAVSNQTPTYFAVRTVLTNGQVSAEAMLPAINTSSAYPSAPSVNSVEGDGEVALNWNSVANATGFNIYRTTGMVDWQLVGTTPNTQTGYVDYSVVNDVHYYYVVASLGVVNSQQVISSWSDQNGVVSVTPHVRQPLPPTGLNVIDGNTQATVTWNPVPGAAYYRIYTSGIKGGPYTLEAYSYTNAYTLTNLGNSTPIFVVLEAYDQTEGLASSYSAEVTTTPSGALLSQSTYFTSLVAEYDGVYVSWEPVAGATGYHLYRSIYTSDDEAETWSLISTPAADSVQDTDVTNGVSYEYAVAPVNAGGEGPWTFSSSVTPTATDPLAPANLAALPGNGATTLTWDAVPGATYYWVLYGSTPGGPYSNYDESTTPAYTVNNSTIDTYYFVVESYNGTTRSGYSSQVQGAASSALPATPSLQTPVKGTGQITLNWYATSGASSYLIYRYIPGALNWTLLGQTSALTFIDTAVQSGTTYQYAIAATNGAGVGAWSAQSTGITE